MTEAGDIVGGFVCTALVCALLIGSCQVGFNAGRDGWTQDNATENEKCALRGLVLLRGQQGEFVCVTPGSEKYRRKP